MKEEKGSSHKRHYGIQTPGTVGVSGKKRYCMVIDLRKCTGCGSCVVACKGEHDVPLGVWRMWLKGEDKGVYPNVRRAFLPRLCNHCDYPICVRACPTQATFKHEDGFVLQRYNRCIGCKACMIACPYNARHILPYHRTDSRKPFGVADKCDYCIHRVKRGLVPTCVTTCVGGAFVFGDLNDPSSEVVRLIQKHSINVLRPDMGTKPQTYYIGLDGSIADPIESYEYRTAQIRDEFNAFKANHPGMMGGDIIEGETNPLSFTRRIVSNLWQFFKEIPEKAGLIGRG